MITTERDRDVLARTLWGEARGEGAIGQIAVAWTIRNRVYDNRAKSWWGEGYSGVCLKAWQFSCWNKNDPNYASLIGEKAIPALQLSLAMAVANQVISGAVADPTDGATHYYSNTMAMTPAWVVGAKRTLTLGRHMFYKDVP